MHLELKLKLNRTRVNLSEALAMALPSASPSPGLPDAVVRSPHGYKPERKNSRTFLPERGWVRYRNGRQMLDTVKNVVDCCSNGQWFTSIQTERDAEQLDHPSTSAVASIWAWSALQLCPTRRR
jgi:hypothetical protein